MHPGEKILRGDVWFHHQVMISSQSVHVFPHQGLPWKSLSTLWKHEICLVRVIPGAKATAGNLTKACYASKPQILLYEKLSTSMVVVGKPSFGSTPHGQKLIQDALLVAKSEVVAGKAQSAKSSLKKTIFTEFWGVFSKFCFLMQLLVPLTTSRHPKLRLGLHTLRDLTHSPRLQIPIHSDEQSAQIK